MGRGNVQISYPKLSPVKSHVVLSKGRGTLSSHRCAFGVMAADTLAAARAVWAMKLRDSDGDARMLDSSEGTVSAPSVLQPVTGNQGVTH